MKKSIRIVMLVMAIVLLSVCTLTGCDFSRKLTGAEATFPQRISNANTFYFKMNVVYKKGNSTTQIDMACYKQNGADGKEEYAYVYSCPLALYQSYKNVYADNKLYETAYVTPNSGSYYTKDNVSVDTADNMLYHVKENILLLSVAAFAKKAHKETLNGVDVYRYDVKINDKDVSIWFDSQFLVKCYLKLEGEETEEYTLTMSEYKFDEEIPADVFARPDTYGVTFVESPISFENWMDIITSFSQKLG